jgi:hypothetical protein
MAERMGLDPIRPFQEHLFSKQVVLPIHASLVNFGAVEETRTPTLLRETIFENAASANSSHDRKYGSPGQI